MSAHNYIVSIAGFDPSTGAGITSDVQTFKAHGLYGLSVCTAVTVQNDVNFKSCQWVDTALILDQINILFERFTIPVVKIGIVSDWKVLLTIVEHLLAHNPEIRMVLDPVLKASAGFDFHQEDEMAILEQVLEKITLITPNEEELVALFPEKSLEETIAFIQKRTSLYHKGGHRKDKKGWDSLYLHQGGVQLIPPGVDKIHEKHGSGCVLSAALASQIALGNTLQKAGAEAKTYVETFLNSHASMLGIQQQVTPKVIV